MAYHTLTWDELCAYGVFPHQLCAVFFKVTPLKFSPFLYKLAIKWRGHE